jgi:hypothetical protein
MKVLSSPEIITQPSDNGLCLLHAIRGECHILNNTAAFLWEILEEYSQQPNDGLTPEELAKKLSEKYNISYDNALTDVETFLSDAISLGIITTLSES